MEVTAPANNLQGIWNPRLAETFHPSPAPPGLRGEVPNPALSKHNTGEIWKQAIIKSAFYDLVEVLDPSHLARRQRRFLRLEYLGLSGILLYNIGYPLEKGDPASFLTISRVLGDEADPSRSGMDVTTLLDAIQAKVLFFPAYSCTSFVSGQAMTAHLSQRSSAQPYPLYDGYTVPHDVVDTSCPSPASGSSPQLDAEQTETSPTPARIHQSPAGPSSTPVNPLHAIFSPRGGSISFTPSPRTPAGRQYRPSRLSYSTGSAGDTTFSTNDSASPDTPDDSSLIGRATPAGFRPPLSPLTWCREDDETDISLYLSPSVRKYLRGEVVQDASEAGVTQE